MKPGDSGVAAFRPPAAESLRLCFNLFIASRGTAFSKGQETRQTAKMLILQQRIAHF